MVGALGALNRNGQIFSIGSQRSEASYNPSASDHSPATSPVVTGLKPTLSTDDARSQRTKEHASRDLPTPVSVPVTNNPRVSRIMPVLAAMPENRVCSHACLKDGRFREILSAFPRRFGSENLGRARLFLWRNTGSAPDYFFT